jgi:hypothetical protein
MLFKLVFLGLVSIFAVIDISQPNRLLAFNTIIVGTEKTNEMKYSNNFFNQEHSISLQQQTTAITLESSNLKYPCLLKIDTQGSKINGQIIINSDVIISLDNTTEAINLSPYLSTGSNIIEISGDYSPSTAAIAVELSAVGNSVRQQSSGSGNLRHTLIINVR